MTQSKHMHVCIHNITNFFAVSAAHAAYQGNIPLFCSVQNKFVTQSDSVLCHFQFPQLIGFKNIHTTLIKHKIRGKFVQNTRQLRFQFTEIGFIVRVRFQINILIGFFLLHRVIGATVHTERENFRHIGKDFCRSVSLVNIEIND